MAKKIDFNALKPLLFQYGDKAALGLAALVTVLLITMGLLSAKNAAKTDWAEDLKKAADSLNNKIQQATAPEPDPIKMKALEPKLYDWAQFTSRFVPGAYIHLTETADIKKRNPLVLDVRKDAENFQLDYIAGLYYSYSLNSRNLKIEVFGGGKAAGAGPNAPAPGGPLAGGGQSQHNPVKSVDYVRMVVVQGVFPMRDQVEQFRRAFRLNSQAELFASRDWPRPLGLDVYRIEILPDGKDGKETMLYLRDKKEQVEMAKPIAELFKQAMFDEEGLQAIEPYVHAGLVTPLPLLANTHYHKLKIAAIEPVVVADATGKPGFGPGAPGGPMAPGGLMAPGGNNAGGQTEFVSWRSFPMAERFEGKIEPFHPLGEPLTKPEDKANAPAAPMPPGYPRPGMPGGVGPGMQGGTMHFSPFEQHGLAGGGAAGPGPMGPGFRPGGPAPGAQQPQPQAGSTETWRYDALIRFIDVGVEPNKKYKYKVRVRMANPNYGKKDEVAFAALADYKEIEPLSWIVTPEIRIPSEYHYYAVDQQLLDKGEKGSSKEVAAAAKNEQTTLQIHRWFDIAKDQLNGREYAIGDWAVADRMLVRRGEFIGQYQLRTEVPVWNKEKGAFEVPEAQVQDSKKKTVTKEGIPLDFMPPLDPAIKGDVKPPLLVDFEGGRRDNVRIGKDSVRDESAIDVLIMTPEGKLTVRNSGYDADPKSRGGRVRKERLELWREHVHQAQAGGADRGNQPGPGLPGAPGVGLPGAPKKN